MIFVGFSTDTNKINILYSNSSLILLIFNHTLTLLSLSTITSLISYKCFIVRQQFNNILNMKNNNNLKKIHQAIYRIYESIVEFDDHICVLYYIITFYEHGNNSSNNMSISSLYSFKIS